jgi:hypothetical protein
MKNLIAYFEGKAAELKALIAEAERERQMPPRWLVEAQANAALVKIAHKHGNA